MKRDYYKVAFAPVKQEPSLDDAIYDDYLMTPREAVETYARVAFTGNLLEEYEDYAFAVWRGGAVADDQPVLTGLVMVVIDACVKEDDMSKVNAKMDLCYAVLCDGQLYGWKVLYDQRDLLPKSLSALSGKYYPVNGNVSVIVAVITGDCGAWFSQWANHPGMPGAMPPRAASTYRLVRETTFELRRPE